MSRQLKKVSSFPFFRNTFVNHSVKCTVGIKWLLVCCWGYQISFYARVSSSKGPVVWPLCLPSNIPPAASSSKKRMLFGNHTGSPHCSLSCQILLILFFWCTLKLHYYVSVPSPGHSLAGVSSPFFPQGLLIDLHPSTSLKNCVQWHESWGGRLNAIERGNSHSPPPNLIRTPGPQWHLNDLWTKSG